MDIEKELKTGTRKITIRKHLKIQLYKTDKSGPSKNNSVKKTSPQLYQKVTKKDKYKS